MICAAPYSPPIITLITGLKFHGRTEVIPLLARLLIDAINAPLAITTFDTAGVKEQSSPDIIVPVPLHVGRHWKRGYNQAHLLAAKVGQSIGVPVVSALTRVRATKPQSLTKSSLRKRNLRNAFKLANRVSDYHVALIDDVVTTGATISEASKVLIESGAQSIRIWACARA